MKRITLPAVQADGTPHWADIRGPEDLSADDYLEFTAAAAGSDTSQLGEMTKTSLKALLALGVAGWSLTGPNGDTLPIPSADPTVTVHIKPLPVAVSLFSAVQPIMSMLIDRVEDPKDPDPMSPTVPSAD